MRKRDIQSFTLKLSDMKEYETMRAQRTAIRDAATAAALAQAMATDDTPVGLANAKPPLVRVGPKSKAEIRERLGFPET